MQHYRLVLVLVIAMTLAAFLIWMGTRALQPAGVRVTVLNRGPEPLRDVAVHVTGNVHRIGNLGVGKSGTVTVRPTGESHVEIEFLDPQGQQKRLNAGGHFEAGNYRGTIDIDLENAAITRNLQQVELAPY